VDGRMSVRREIEGLGYGLFWREDLNWRFPVWQWTENTVELRHEESHGPDDGVDDLVHV